MGEAQGENPWRRTLRSGMKGRDVALLQERLARLGYYSGEIDGIFAILTKDAVRDLQKSHRLRVDGIAGREVFAVLRSGLARPQLRHVVARGETLAHIARRHNIPMELLVQCNQLSAPEVQEGQCLDIPVARLVAYCAGGEGAERSWGPYERHLAVISEVAPRWFTLRADGTVMGEPAKRVAALASLADILVLPVVADGAPAALPARPGAGQETGGDEQGDGERAHQAALEAVLIDARARRAAMRSITGAAARSGAHGVILSVSGPCPCPGSGPDDPYAFTSFVRELARALWEDGRSLAVELPLPGADDLDTGTCRFEYSEIAQVARQIILRLYEEPGRLAVPGPPSSPARARAVLKAMVRVVPPWKLVAGAPLFGVDFSAAPGARPLRKTYSEVGDILDIYRPSVSRTEPGGSCMFRYRSFRVNHTVFFEDATSIASHVDLALKFKLAGLAVSDLGDEDPLMWDAFRTRFKALRGSVMPA